MAETSSENYNSGDFNLKTGYNASEKETYTKGLRDEIDNCTVPA
jgi:hypothetical protein